MNSPRRKARRTIDDLEIADMTHDGRGVGRVDGKAVFVDGALRGERVDVEIVKQRRSYDQAHVTAIRVASAERVEPLCEAFGRCGGCALQHQSIAAQRDIKRDALAAALDKIGKVAPARWLDDLTAGEWGYRRKARLGVKYVTRKERVLVGFREKHKPYVTDMQRCEVLDPRVGGLLEPLAAMIATLGVRSQLPQIEVACGESHVALVIRVLAPPSAADTRQLHAFATQNDLDIYLQPGGQDSIAPLTDVRPLTYSLEEFDVVLQFEPTDFIQVHALLNRRMVSHVVDLLDVQTEHTVLDLFCGLGNFSLPLARRAGTVLGVEGDAALVQRARDNATRNGLTNLQFQTADLSGATDQWQWPRTPVDRVLIDPPRTGAQEVLETLAGTAAKCLVYVSCHPGTLARDSHELVHTHGFELAAAGIMDMFPHTAHVESVAVFKR